MAHLKVDDLPAMAVPIDLRVPDELAFLKKRNVLPESSTRLLRSWLISHLDHPFPSKQEKQRLCQLSKMSPLQLKYWFTNARRRIVPHLRQQRLRKSSQNTNASSDCFSSERSESARHVAQNTHSSPNSYPSERGDLTGRVARLREQSGSGVPIELIQTARAPVITTTASYVRELEDDERTVSESSLAEWDVSKEKQSGFGIECWEQPPPLIPTHLLSSAGALPVPLPGPNVVWTHPDGHVSKTSNVIACQPVPFGTVVHTDLNSFKPRPVVTYGPPLLQYCPLALSVQSGVRWAQTLQPITSQSSAAKYQRCLV